MSEERECSTVWIDDEPWSCEEFDPYQNYLCETETVDPPFSCRNVARYELICMSDWPSDDPDACGSRLYRCEVCVEKLKTNV